MASRRPLHGANSHFRRNNPTSSMCTLRLADWCTMFRVRVPIQVILTRRFVLGLMYVMYPIAYPTAMILDRVLGKEEGTTYKKAGLKTLVSLHRTLGTERLNDDEVTIITAVLDLKEKPVGDIMTPLKDVYVMSADQIMDVKTMNEILSKGYSRIPIHAPGNNEDFIGMLLVKTLITYDPEDEWSVSAFTLATLPETKPTTSALDILNYFQEYTTSHSMLIVGENHIWF